LAWRSIHWKPNPEFEVGAMAARFALLAAPFAAWHIWQGVPWIAAMTATTVASFLFGSVVLRWRSIAAAAGLHAAANFVRDMVLPLSISQQRRSQLYRTAIYHFNDECCCSSL
jgi:membrane protease YdiL (CAAX protease family)